MKLSSYLETYPSDVEELEAHYHTNIVQGICYLRENFSGDIEVSPPDWGKFIHSIALEVEEDEEAVVEFCDGCVAHWQSIDTSDEDVVELTDDMIIDSEDVVDTEDSVDVTDELEATDELDVHGLRAWKAKRLQNVASFNDGLEMPAIRFIDYLADAILENPDTKVNTVPKSLFEEVIELHSQLPLDPLPLIPVIDPQNLTRLDFLKHLRDLREDYQELLEKVKRACEDNDDDDDDSESERPKSEWVEKLSDVEKARRGFPKNNDVHIYRMKDRKVRSTKPPKNLQGRVGTVSDFVKKSSSNGGSASHSKDLWGAELEKLKRTSESLNGEGEDSSNGEYIPYFQRVATEESPEPIAKVKPSRVRSEISIDHGEFLGIIRDMIDAGLFEVGLPTAASSPTGTEGYVFELDDLSLDEETGDFVLSFNGQPMPEGHPNRALIDADALSGLWESDPDVSDVFGVSPTLIPKSESDQPSGMFDDFDSSFGFLDSRTTLPGGDGE